MAKPFRPKRGTTAKNDAFVGKQYEITLDKDKSSLRVHDGLTAGGVAEILPKAKNDELYAPKGSGVTSVNNETGAVYVKKLIMGEHVLELKEDGTLMLDANAVITSAGGTFTGQNLFFPCGVISSTNNDSYKEIWFGADSNYNEGATITLCNKDSPNNPGYFIVRANNASINCALIGTPDGGLKWGSRNIPRVVEVRDLTSPSLEAKKDTNQVVSYVTEKKGNRFVIVELSGDGAYWSYLACRVHTLTETGFSVGFYNNGSGTSGAVAYRAFVFEY